MKQFHKLSAWFVCLSLAACQTPSNLSTASLNPVINTAANTSNKLVFDEKNRQYSNNPGLLQKCGTTASGDCDLSDLLTQDLDSFKRLFKSAVEAHTLSQQVAFKLLFLAMIDKNEPAIQFLQTQGILLSKPDLRYLEDEGVFFLHGDSEPAGFSSIDSLNLNSKSAERFATFSLSSFRALSQKVSPDAKADFFQDMLYYASAAGNLPVLKYLVEQGVDIQLEKAKKYAQFPDFLSALYYALVFWQPEASIYLIQQGARINPVFLQSSANFQNKSIWDNSNITGESDLLVKNQLIYQLANHPHKNVRQIFEILLNEPIAKPTIDSLADNKLPAIGLAKELQRDLLSVAAGYPNDKMDLDGIKTLLEAGARSYGPIHMQIQSYQIPTAIEQIIKQTGTLESKKPALDLLIKYDPELNLRQVVDVEIIDYLVSQLASFPQLKNELLKTRSKVLTSQSLTQPKKGDCSILQNLNMQNISSADLKLIGASITNTDCSDEEVLTLIDESKPLVLTQQEFSSILLIIAGYRAKLLPRFLENTRYSLNPKENLQVIFHNLDNYFSGKIDPNPFRTTFLDPAFLKTLLALRSEYLPSTKIFLQPATLRRLFTNQEYARFLPFTADVKSFIEILDSSSVNGQEQDWGPLLTYISKTELLVDFIEQGADINVTKNFAQHHTNPITSFQPMKQNVYESAISYISEFAGVLTNAVNIPFYPDQAIQNITYLLSKNPDFTLSDHADLFYAAVNSTIFNGRSGDLRLLQYILSHVSESQRKLLLQDELLLYAIMVSTGGQPVERAVYVEKFLLEQGLNMEVHNRNYETPLILAAKNKFENMYQLLLKAGANPNSRDVYGRSAKEIHDASQLPSPGVSATASP